MTTRRAHLSTIAAIVEAVEQYGSLRKAAAHIGIAPGTLSNALNGYPVSRRTEKRIRTKLGRGPLDSRQRIRRAADLEPGQLPAYEAWLKSEGCDSLSTYVQRQLRRYGVSNSLDGRCIERSRVGVTSDTK